MQRVRLPDRTRGGLLSMASVLTATSSPARTNPVNRGKWVLETLLGETVPDPPADAGELPGDAGEGRGKTLREELALHRRNATCAACHDKLDPIGFGLENYDAIGRFRRQQANQPIDASGQLPDGATFAGVEELKVLLVRSRQAAFVRNITERLLSFALGRQLQYYDEPAVDQIVAAVRADDDSAATLVKAIVRSYPFQFRNNRPRQQQ